MASTNFANSSGLLFERLLLLQIALTILLIVVKHVTDGSDVVYRIEFDGSVLLIVDLIDVLSGNRRQAIISS